MVERAGKLNLRVLFVLDTTYSMVAEDYGEGQPRYDGVVQDCAYIVEHLKGASFSLINFDNTATQKMPYTNNGEYLISTIEAIRPSFPKHALGTTLDRPIPLMKKSIQTARESFKNIGEAGKVVVFYISDGEETNAKQAIDFKEFADLIDDGAVLGYGTEEGGMMHYIDYFGDACTVEDARGYDGVAVLDEDNLKRIADDMAVPYVHMQKSEDIDKVLDKIMSNVDYQVLEEVDAEVYNPLEGANDLSFWFAIPLVCMLVLEGVFLIRKK